ncbi:MAG TPA: NAD(P)-dependent oxidoreductase [Leptolyngbyaceae cyanobacterium]
MKVFVTGASGFLGKYVVDAALAKGHHVLAMVRPTSKVERLPWHDNSNVTLVRQDLRQARELADVLEGVDAVIHLAAVKSGDFYDQFAGTVIATENLLDAMVASKVQRLIAISTFSVYDYMAKRSGTLLDESFPIEDSPLDRDEYAQTKLIQEDLYRAFEKEQNGEVTILRPGMIYGPNNLWNPCLGAEFGSSFLRIGAGGKMPLTYVENCAEAIVAAVDQPASIGQTINIVDDNLPKKSVFTRELLKRDSNPPKVVAVNWGIMKLIAGTAWFVNQQFLGGKARLPGILVPAKLNARFKPFRYSNDLAKKYLQWTPRYTLEQALDRSIAAEG